MFWMFSDIFTAVYTCEFAIKFYADRARYWVSVYNIFDFAILVVAYVDMLMTLISAAYVYSFKLFIGNQREIVELKRIVEIFA